MEKQLKEIEIPFGAKDSELCGWEYTIPEGMKATIVDNKIVVKKKENEDEFAHIVGYLVQDVVANEHMPEEEKQPTKFFVEKYYNKLRPQNRWKPSDEQMEALNDVISSRDIKYGILSELWQDLKKLRDD
jgi:hypothetical protein